MRSILKKTIYDVANPSQFPSLKRYKNPNPAVYVPAEPETEILITQNPASSTVGVSNSVSFVPSSLPVSPLCHCFSIVLCPCPTPTQTMLILLSPYQLFPAYQNIIDKIVEACPCFEKRCVKNCLNATCFLTDWSVSY